MSGGPHPRKSGGERHRAQPGAESVRPAASDRDAKQATAPGQRSIPRLGDRAVKIVRARRSLPRYETADEDGRAHDPNSPMGRPRHPKRLARWTYSASQGQWRRLREGHRCPPINARRTGPAPGEGRTAALAQQGGRDSHHPARRGATMCGYYVSPSDAASSRYSASVGATRIRPGRDTTSPAPGRRSAGRSSMPARCRLAEAAPHCLAEPHA